MNKKIYSPVLIAVAINILLPFLLNPLATENQIKPPNGAASLSYFDQLMHMFVHHAQVPLSSSIIVAIIVFLSIFISQKIC
jgi:hypothetical protein